LIVGFASKSRRTTMAKNYYIVLGIPSDATGQQIRSAYLQLAKELHPDHFGPDYRPFLDVQEAYSVLGDPARREAYDRTIHRSRIHGRSGPSRPEPLTTRKPFAEPLKSADGPVDMGEASLTRSFRTFSPSFDEIFDRLWSNFSRLTRPKEERIESLTAEVMLTLEEAERGGHIRIMVPSRAICPTCEGYGGVDLYECWRCAGEGAISGEFPLLVSFPPGIANDYLVRIPLDRFGIRNMYLTVHFRMTENPA
jgi:DnaJ-class molecular chaperone